MDPLAKLTRSFILSAIGGWLAIFGMATVLASRELYADDGPIPLVGGIEAYVFPAATIANLKTAGYVTISLGLVLIAITALHRAAHAQPPSSRPDRGWVIVLEDAAPSARE